MNRPAGWKGWDRRVGSKRVGSTAWTPSPRSSGSPSCSRSPAPPATSPRPSAGPPTSSALSTRTSWRRWPTRARSPGSTASARRPRRSSPRPSPAARPSTWSHWRGRASNRPGPRRPTATTKPPPPPAGTIGTRPTRRPRWPTPRRSCPRRSPSGRSCRATATATRSGPTVAASIRDMAEAARDLDHRYLVMTDHSPRLTVAHGLTAERLRQQLDEIAGLNDELAPFRILTGIEVDILADGALDQTDELLAALDVVVASAHSKLRMAPADDGPAGGRRREPPHRRPRALHGATHRRPGPPAVDVRRRRRLRRVRPDGDGGRDQLPPRAPRPAAGAARPGGRARLPLLRRHRCACPRSAHLAGPRCNQAAAAGIPAERIVNTWSLDELLAWTAAG